MFLGSCLNYYSTDLENFLDKRLWVEHGFCLEEVGQPVTNRSHNCYRRLQVPPEKFVVSRCRCWGGGGWLGEDSQLRSEDVLVVMLVTDLGLQVWQGLRLAVTHVGLDTRPWGSPWEVTGMVTNEILLLFQFVSDFVYTQPNGAKLFEKSWPSKL